MSEDFREYKHFKVGSYVARKGQLCVIEAIDWSVHPPTVTVKTADTNDEIGTEFSNLDRVHSWICKICTAPNPQIDADECSFCHLRRDWTEELILEGQTETKDTIENKERRWRLFADSNQNEKDGNAQDSTSRCGLM